MRGVYKMKDCIFIHSIMYAAVLQVIPTMLSLVVSYQSAIMILGTPAEMFIHGIQAWPMRMLSFCITIPIVERLIVPWLYPLRLTSIFEVLAIHGIYTVE